MDWFVGENLNRIFHMVFTILFLCFYNFFPWFVGETIWFFHMVFTIKVMGLSGEHDPQQTQ